MCVPVCVPRDEPLAFENENCCWEECVRRKNPRFVVSVVRFGGDRFGGVFVRGVTRDPVVRWS